jgi:hypothetical protein
MERKERKFSTISQDKFNRACEKTSWTCGYCGRSLSRETRDFAIDHMMPRCRSGTNGEQNLVAACHRCNTAKGSRTPEEFKRQLARRACQGIETARRVLEVYGHQMSYVDGGDDCAELATLLLARAEDIISRCYLYFPCDDFSEADRVIIPDDYESEVAL